MLKRRNIKASKQVKRSSTHLSSGNCISNHSKIPPPRQSLRMVKIRKITMIVSENVAELEPPHPGENFCKLATATLERVWQFLKPLNRVTT